MALFQLGLQGYSKTNYSKNVSVGKKNNNHHHHQNKAFQQFPAQSYPKYPTTSQLAACWLGGDFFPLEMVPQEPFCTGCIGRMTQSRKVSSVEASPLTLSNPSPVRTAQPAAPCSAREPRGRGHHTSVSVPKVQQPELFPDSEHLWKVTEKSDSPLSTAQTAQLPPPPLSLWTSHPHRHWEG